MRGQAIRALIRKQIIEIKSSTQLRALTLIAPLLQMTLFGFAANLDVATVSTAIVDMDRSARSRELVARFESTGMFDVRQWLDRYDDADRVLLDGSSRLVIVIPPGFSRRIAARQPAPLQALIDGSDGYVAGIAGAYAGAVVADYSRDVLLETQRVTPAGRVPAPQVEPRTRVWYNPDLKTRRFFIPGIFGLLLMITTVIASSTSIVKERENGTLEQLVVSPVRPYQIIIGKLAPFAVTATVTMLNLLLLAWLVFGISMRGNVLLFLLLTIVFEIVILGLGLFISTISRTQQQASFTTTFFVLPPFLFLSGFSFPIENMPGWIQVLTYAIPLRYYLDVIRGIFMTGAGLAELWPSLVAMLAIGAVIFGASILRFRKSLE
ncbi:MAG TPA: ABC transporter permease [Candidatus Kapabacteria bacterium]|jgi:ABC-2 type transport system permease protein|nr:ABC transporter permease [Candidatus Kapabacteria bacterium]HVK37725.1 ABC transporter permease [Candidatus Kapabacteria bacterium]